MKKSFDTSTYIDMHKTWLFKKKIKKDYNRLLKYIKYIIKLSFFKKYSKTLGNRVFIWIVIFNFLKLW